jgi:hypothetical protein
MIDDSDSDSDSDSGSDSGSDYAWRCGDLGFGDLTWVD